MKSAPGRATVAPVGGFPLKEPVLVPRISHRAATVPSPVAWWLIMSKERSGKAVKSPAAYSPMAWPLSPSGMLGSV